LSKCGKPEIKTFGGFAVLVFILPCGFKISFLRTPSLRYKQSFPKHTAKAENFILLKEECLWAGRFAVHY
jgi:hypothetical protein